GNESLATRPFVDCGAVCGWIADGNTLSFLKLHDLAFVNVAPTPEDFASGLDLQGNLTVFAERVDFTGLLFDPSSVNMFGVVHVGRNAKAHFTDCVFHKLKGAVARPIVTDQAGSW
ncbi:MAG: hypothetical protein MI748_05375, partial [Opitutales bacterium]|nr:hypothetical protein [Opitutales bacterium]